MLEKTPFRSYVTSVLTAILVGGTGMIVLPDLVNAAAPDAPVTTVSTVEFDRDGDGRTGEATAIRKRTEHYLKSRSIDGAYTSSDALARAQWGYEKWLEEGRQRQKNGIEGNGWVSIGPDNGAGRSVAVVPHPTNPGTLLTGAAGGGLWRTLDSGLSWTPLTDGIPDLSAGAAAYAPQNPGIIYFGTGEGGYAADFIPGIGLLRSDDGGETWFLPRSSSEILASQFFALSVKHPEGSNVLDPFTYEVLAATNEGLFRSLDGGETWDMVIGQSSLVGISEVIRPDVDQDPNLVYAALWCGGACPAGTARVMKSLDSGLTWAPAASGLPALTSNSSRNRISLTSTRDGETLYVGLNTSADINGSPEAMIYRSDDGGTSWYQTGNTGTYLGSQGWYDNTITVHPTNPEIVIGGGVWYVVSNNGGTSWQTKNPYASGTSILPHVDAHDLQWQDDTLWVACDGGIWYSTDFGSTYTGRNESLVTRQYYGMALDPIERERVIGGTQDNGTDLRDLSGDNSWNDVIGGDGFDCAINSLVSDIMYGTVYYTRVYRSTNGGVDWLDNGPYFGSDETPFVTSLNMLWSQPWILYTGSNRVWKTDDGGDSWANLSKVVENGNWGLDVVRAIASTPADPEMIMVARGNRVFTSHNSGKSWYSSPMGRTVNNMAISPFNPDLAIACKSGSSSGLGVMLTYDGGINWQIAGYGLPPFAVHSAVWDPIDEDTVYAGTDVGLYRSIDGGINWNTIGDGLPAASIHDVRVLPDGSMLRVATHGRGMWELQIDQVDNRNPSVNITSHGSSFGGTVGDLLELSATASDPDGDEISVQWIVTDLWSTHSGGSGTGTFISEEQLMLESGGKYEIIAHVTDNKGGAAYDRIKGIVFEPANECATPRVVPSNGPFPFSVRTSNTTATQAASDPHVWCIDDPDDPDAGSAASLWFEFTPDESNNYQISTCTSQSDTVLSLWTGDTCGPYTQVPGQSCDDDDELVHCYGQRTDSYINVDLVGGTTYRIMLGAYNSSSKGRVRLHVACNTCETPLPGSHYIVPAAANAPGNNDTMWLTDLDLFNSLDVDITADISFLPADGNNTSATTYPVMISAGTALAYTDVVSSLLQTSGSGAISIMASDELLIASKTYNNAEEGTFGQFIPGVGAETAIPPGANVRMIGLVGNDAFRTNIGVSNTTGASASVNIELYDDSGILLGTRSETLDPMGWLQVTDIFGKENIDDVEAASAIVYNTSAEATIITYASIVDEITGDPIYVTTANTATASDPVMITASAHAEGSGTSVWRTDLELANVSEENLVVTIEVLVKNSDNSSPISTTHLIPAATNLKIPDVLATDFEITGSAALRISVDRGELMATSRTYNQTPEGTYGQFIPGVFESGAIKTGEQALLFQLRQQADLFRTNIGIVNLTGSEIAVDANFYNNDGSYIGYAQYTMMPYEYDQANEAFPGGNETEGGYVVLSSQTAGAEFLAYASVIDSGSDDPVYIPATILQ